MKKVLLIGDYFPNLSWESFRNKSIAESLSNNGYKVILLSKSWCDVTEDCFIGNVNELSQNAPFTNRYFIDPCQMKRTGELLNGFLGLVCKIIPYEKIDFVLFSEQIQFVQLAELIRNRFDIPCYLSLFSFSTISGYLHDDYALEYLGKTLSYFEKIFTLDSYCERLSRIVSNGNLSVSLPFNTPQTINRASDSNEMSVVGILRNVTQARVLATKLQNTFDAIRKYFLLAGKDVNKLMTFFHLVNVEYYQQIANLSDFSLLSRTRPVLFTDAILGKMGFIEYYTAMKYGYTIIIGKDDFNKIENSTGIITEPFLQDYLLVTGIQSKNVIFSDLINK